MVIKMENIGGERFFLWDYLKECGKPLVMYGTGDGADKIMAVMEQYELKPACFTTTGDFSAKPNFRDYRVMPFDEVEKRFSDFVILICFGSEMPQVLEKLYALTEKYEVFAPDVPVAGDLSLSGIYTPEYIEVNREKIEKVRNMLADEKSREVFDGWLEYRLGGGIDILEQIATPREESLSLLKLSNKGNEFFIDAGAYKGDTVDEFLKMTGKSFKKIIAIEPDEKNHIALRRKFYAYGSGILVPVNAAAWGTDERIEFTVKKGRAGMAGIGGVRGNKRVKMIDGVKIDTLCKDCKDEKPTYIKIDVEGAEAEVLKGAKSVITRYRPKMMVSLYHRSEDMFELPLLINSFYSRYKFHLRKTHCLPGWEFQLIVSI
ncbi:MAG: FkbM family methyltransferase [Oscillospiraceae bacterium]|nr:FkbM family methyltransferase [Oscillospiraceae bacterium]